MPRPQVLDRVLTTYRIGDPDGEYPLYDATGSRHYPGRWNTAETPLLYTSSNYSLALLEKIARSSSLLPPNQHDIVITIPNGLSYEIFDPAALPGWDAPIPSVSRHHGARWKAEARTAILIVPSVIARLDTNVLINPDHPQAAAITHSLHHPVAWDERLYPGTPPPAGLGDPEV
jgi:RES domain-containing protein